MSLNPNDRMPAIIDPVSLDARLITVWESGAILAYLVSRADELLPSTPAKRCKTLTWVFFRMTAIKRPRQCSTDKSERLRGIQDRRLEGRDWTIDDHSVADIVTLDWVNALVHSYAADDIFGRSNSSKTQALFGRRLAQPAMQHGLHFLAGTA